MWLSFQNILGLAPSLIRFWHMPSKDVEHFCQNFLGLAPGIICFWHMPFEGAVGQMAWEWNLGGFLMLYWLHQWTVVTLLPKYCRTCLICFWYMPSKDVETFCFWHMHFEGAVGQTTWEWNLGECLMLHWLHQWTVAPTIVWAKLLYDPEFLVIGSLFQCECLT